MRRLCITRLSTRNSQLATAAVLAAASGVTERAVGSCPCGGPSTKLIGADRGDAAPLNTKVRIETFVITAVAVGPRHGARGFVLRGSDAPPR